MKKYRPIELIFALIEIALAVMFFLIFGEKTDANLEELKVLSFATFLIVVILFFKSFIINKNILSFYKLFLLFYTIYIYGIIFLRYIFDFEVYEVTHYLDNTIGPNVLYEGVLYSIILLLSIDIGYSIFDMFNNVSKSKINEFINLECPKSLKILGYILFLMSAFFAFKELYETIKLVLVYGYKGQIENVSYGLSSIGSQIVPFFMISIYILVIYYKDAKIERNFFFFIGMVYSIFLIFLGRRGIPLLNLFGLIIINVSFSKEINIRKFLKLIVLLFVITIFISVIRDNRDIPLQNWGDNLISLISEKARRNPVSESIYEMGLGIYPISYSMQIVPDIIPSLNGATYIHAFTDNLMFNFSNSKKEKQSYNCGEIIAKYQGYQFGSSFIEEIYCNFQWYGVIAGVLIGMLIGRFSKIYSNSRNVLVKILLLKIFMEFIWSIKNVLYDLPRQFVLYFLSIIILNIIINKKIIKRDKYAKNISFNI